MTKYHAQFLLDKEKGKDSAKIRYRIKWNGNIVSFNLGYRVDISKWSLETQRCKNNTTHGKKKISASTINKKIQIFQNACEDLFVRYDLNERVPNKDEFREDFNVAVGKIDAEKRKNYNKTFFELFDEFISEEALLYQWTKITKSRFLKLKEHLFNFDDKMNFESIDESHLAEYQYYLQEDLEFRVATILKHFSNLKRFLRWATKKRYNKNDKFEYFTPKVKNVKKKVIFLTQDEIKKVKSCQIPASKTYLERVRDVFLFQCFTGLRYSDMKNLKRIDVKEKHIEVTAIKTSDSLIIELNKHSRAILDKYKDYDFPNNGALPVISNQRMNDYLKELMQLAEIDEPIRETYYIGNKRFDTVSPKYELIGSHAGRRTFICTALSLGISPQVVMKWTGHNDYKSMKPYIDIADEIKMNAMGKFDSI